MAADSNIAGSEAACLIYAEAAVKMNTSLC